MNTGHPEVVILGYSEAAMYLRRHACDVGALLTINGRREHAVEPGDVRRHLALSFDDVESPDVDDPMEAARVRMLLRAWSEIGLVMAPPAREHADAIIRFAQDVSGISGCLLCHCWAGISRSPAAALLCLAAWTQPGEEVYCVERMLRARPCAIPHAELVAFGDKALDRGGRLVEALRSRQP